MTRLIPRRRRKAVAYILAVILLAMFTGLAAAMASFSNVGLQISRNQQQEVDARAAAECGLRFMVRHLQEVPVPRWVDDAHFMDWLADHLRSRLEETANVPAGGIAFHDGVLSIPQIAYEGGRFAATIESLGGMRVRMQVTGTAHNLSRRVSVTFVAQRGSMGRFDYGIATRGPLHIQGNSSFRPYSGPDLSPDEPGHVQVLSESAEGNAISLQGNVLLDGEMCLAEADGGVSLVGNITVGDTRNHAEIIANHVHAGVGTPVYPEWDTEEIRLLAVNVWPCDPVSGGPSSPVYENLYIPAGSDPHFGGNTTINGVVYIEAPNNVRFGGNVTVNAIVAGEEVPEAHLVPADCTIDFGGNVASEPGVENSIIAPSFSVSVRGNSHSVQGLVIVRQIDFVGNSSAQVNGSIVVLGEGATRFLGNVGMTFRQSRPVDEYIGITGPRVMRLEPDSYDEL